MRLRRKNLARKVYCRYVQVRAFQVIVYKSIIDSENDVRNPGAEQIDKVLARPAVTNVFQRQPRRRSSWAWSTDGFSQTG